MDCWYNTNLYGSRSRSRRRQAERICKKSECNFYSRAKRVVEKVSTGIEEYKKTWEKKETARDDWESAYSSLGKDEVSGVTKIQIIAVLRAESRLVELEDTNLTLAERKLLAYSNTLTTDGQAITALFFIERGKNFEEEAKKKRKKKDAARKTELLRRAQACMDVADFFKPSEIIAPPLI